jgi:hypothetical protein
MTTGGWCSMDARILLDILRQRGVTLAVAGGDLRYHPKRAVDPATVALLKQHKAELVRLLEEQQRRQPDDADQHALELPPPLSNQLTDLLDRLHAHGCKVECLPDGVTLRAACPSCRMAGALDLSEGTDGLPVIRSRCNCLDPLAALEGLEAVPLSEFRKPKTPPPPRKPKPRKPDVVCPCGSTQWRDVPIHGGRSIRRVCARCGRFIAFPLWYGRADTVDTVYETPAKHKEFGGFVDADSVDAAKEDEPASAQAQGADGGGEAGAERPTWWPSWAQEYYERLQRAGCSPKIVVARGNGGQPTLAIEATCPGCGWVDGLSAWPLSTGTMAFRCRAGCDQKEVAAGLEQRLKQRS